MSALTHEQYEQFLADKFRPTWAEAEKLSAAEDEPEEPFKSKYKANELLVSILIQKYFRVLIILCLVEIEGRFTTLCERSRKSEFG